MGVATFSWRSEIDGDRKEGHIMALWMDDEKTLIERCNNEREKKEKKKKKKREKKKK